MPGDRWLRMNGNRIGINEIDVTVNNSMCSSTANWGCYGAVRAILPERLDNECLDAGRDRAGTDYRSRTTGCVGTLTAGRISRVACD